VFGDVTVAVHRPLSPIRFDDGERVQVVTPTHDFAVLDRDYRDEAVQVPLSIVDDLSPSRPFATTSKYGAIAFVYGCHGSSPSMRRC
jgi:hypothetical protein